jgi:hypothetical protein
MYHRYVLTAARATPWWAWFTIDRGLAVAGLMLTIAGGAVGLWQLWRTKRAVEQAREASLVTKDVLRAGDLRRLIEATFACRKRLDDAKKSAKAVQIVLTDWLDAYARIVALLSATADIGQPNREAAETALETAKASILLVREHTGSQDSFRSVNTRDLDDALTSYAKVMNAVILDIEDDQVARYVG